MLMGALINSSFTAREPESRKLLTAKDINDFIGHPTHGGGSEPTHTIENDLGVGCEETVGTDMARLLQPAFDEICIRNRHGIGIFDRLACDLAENDIVAMKIGHDDCRTALGLTEV